MPAAHKISTLFIVGTPLNDQGSLSSEAIHCLSSSDLIIAESKKNGFRFIKQAGVKEPTPIFFLDNIRENHWIELKQLIQNLAKKSSKIALFSDTGMPLLFDPGAEVLNLAKSLNYEIKSVPSATSWGSACALSGWNPPFLVFGFLPREIDDRKSRLQELKPSIYHTVLMDTPYRFEALLSQIAEVIGNEREVFLAWEISNPEEKLLWGSVQSIRREAEKLNLKKGEFILIIQGLSRVK